jgi:hypothetical protein
MYCVLVFLRRLNCTLGSVQVGPSPRHDLSFWYYGIKNMTDYKLSRAPRDRYKYMIRKGTSKITI